LNLYIYLTYGTAPSSGDPACGSTESPGSCNFGFNTAVDAFAKAANAGVNAAVPWWLDVESDPSWSTDTAANASMIQGAIQGLQSEGLNSVGIYSQISHWSGIAGTYSPSVPEWVANWGSNTPPFNPGQYCNGYNFAQGPVQLVQFTDGANTNGFDNDYAC
jgi:GH25 family lysozyme M1 (1,4-beta-N-acetylmuramidase)